MTKSYPKPSQPLALWALSKAAAPPVGVALWWITIQVHSRCSAEASGIHAAGTFALACGIGCGLIVRGGAMAITGGVYGCGLMRGPAKFGPGSEPYEVVVVV